MRDLRRPTHRQTRHEAGRPPDRRAGLLQGALRADGRRLRVLQPRRVEGRVRAPGRRQGGREERRRRLRGRWV